MGLSPAGHEILSVITMSVGMLLVMNGYDTSSFISESVMHSVHSRRPQQIDEYAGYYGPTATYAAYVVGTLLTPWISYRIGAKWTLFAGSIPFTMFIANFFHITQFTYYFVSAIQGIGFALFYSGQGQYLSEHSTKQTISRNSVMMSAIGNQSMMLGGIMLLLITWLNPPQIQQTAEMAAHSFREFSDGEMYVIFGALIVSSVLSNILFAFLPTKQHNSLAQQEPPHKATFTNQIGLLYVTLKEIRILCLLPFFIFYGLHIAFWLIAYPTSFSFARALAHNHYLPAYYSIAVSVGNILVGYFIHFMSNRNPWFGLVPTMFTQVFLLGACYFLIIFCTPNMSTIIPTKAKALFFEPSTWTVILVGILTGMGDCCSSTMRSFVCTIAVPKNRLQAYSVAKLFQSLATCVGTFLAPRLTIYSWMILLIGCQILSCVGFFTVCRHINQEEKTKVVPTGV